MKDFLDQLADVEVREPPPEFDRRLHERLNRALLFQQVTDLFLGAIPWAVAHFARAAAGWLALTLTGNFPKDGAIKGQIDGRPLHGDGTND